MDTRLPEGQEGVVSRVQLRARGWTSRRVQGRLDTGRWQRVHPGVYATFTGPLTPAARAWAALLYAGDGAALSGGTALWTWAVYSWAPAVVEVSVPADRRVAAQPGLRVVRRRGLAGVVHPTASPARLRLDDVVLDVAERTARPEDAVSLLITVVQRRFTTAPRLLAALAERRRHARRGLVEDVLGDVVDGVMSTLEREYLRSVHRPHALPTAAFNAPDRLVQGRRRYRDVRYAYAVVELDGAVAHPVSARDEDHLRDNELTVEGVPSLRYGWATVVGSPCVAAAQVARLLLARGWSGKPRPCQAGCPVGDIVEGRSA